MTRVSELVKQFVQPPTAYSTNVDPRVANIRETRLQEVKKATNGLPSVKLEGRLSPIPSISKEKLSIIERMRGLGIFQPPCPKAD